MNTFVNPDIAYLLLTFGSIFVMMALLTPGTHLLEGGALLVLAAAGAEIYALKLAINLWALLVLVIGLVPFVYAIRRPHREWALALSLLCLIVGSVYIFQGKGWMPAVNPILGIAISILSAVFIWFVVRKGLLAHHAAPLQDPDALIGRIGNAKTEIHADGSVQVASELWSARSDQSIPAGSSVKVVRRDGLTLIVEAQGKSKE
jgi:membrane-bound serine protease (ClpP class)